MAFPETVISMAIEPKSSADRDRLAEVLRRLAKDDARAMIGHHDRMSGWNVSWNSSHGTAGCSLDDFKSTGGAGRFYCFAAE